MKIYGLQGVTGGELNSELARGAKFVYFEYCISLLFVTFRRPSPVYFVRAEQSAASKAAIFCAISLLLGWWGIPWGPIWTIQSFVTNLRGGKDVTRETVAALNESAQSPARTAPKSAAA